MPAGIPSLQQQSPVDPRELRNVCGLFVTGVTVITTEQEGRLEGTTVNSFTSVSLEPPLVLFCLHRASRLRPVVRSAGRFAVNFLSGHQAPLAWAFAGRQSKVAPTAGDRRSAAGMPVLDGALAHLDCRLVNEFDGGDHSIFLGEVTEIGATRRHADPLVFFRGSLGAMDGHEKDSGPVWDG
jgi:flavin reductase (DIM6/NTAB) family NADH-FMN oxidoreductase RutF